MRPLYNPRQDLQGLLHWLMAHLPPRQQRLIGEVFFLRSQVQNMMARRDLLIQQVKASARCELMKEWLEKRVEHWDPEEEYRQHLFLSRGTDQQSGSFSRVATPRSVVGSQFSEDPYF
ncbi:hypothetical protein Bca101_097086 [Brassica carinata]